MELIAIVDFIFEQAIQQSRQAGNPLHPFLVTEQGKAYFFADQTGKASPTVLAVSVLRGPAAQAERIALLTEATVTLREGERCDAFVVYACERDGGDGQLWVQPYSAKRFFKPFQTLGQRELGGTFENFFSIAERAVA
jgi:hypothetical protein